MSETTTYSVKVWSVATQQRKSGQSYGIRWQTAERRHFRAFRSRAHADSFRAELLTAARRGEKFSVMTGLPTSLTPQPATRRWIDHAQDFVDESWQRLAPRSRQSMADALTSITIALLNNNERRPPIKELRAALYGWSFNSAARKQGEPTENLRSAIDWIARYSPEVDELASPVALRGLLDGLALNMDGRPAAATTVARRRAVLHGALRFAVETGHLSHNPIERVRWSAPRVSDGVDVRCVVNHKQAQQLLAAVRSQPRGHYLVAFFGCMYYAALRPAEAVSLRRGNIVLPDTDGEWGEIRLSESDPTTAPQWTDDGRRAPRALKHRAQHDTRLMPCPPQLARLLREHIESHGVTPDGRLFAGRRGGPLSETVYTRVWDAARHQAFSPQDYASPLAKRPYDLRHAAVSTWLAAGVDPTQIAEWAGHSVHVLLRVYAKTVTGRGDIARRKIASTLH